MFAIIDVAGKQYKVSPGDVIEVDHVAGKDGETVSFDHVLLVGNDGKTKVGTPKVAGASVKAKIVGQMKGEKVDIRRFKAKVRVRRNRGFRAHMTKLEIVSIG